MRIAVRTSATRSADPVKRSDVTDQQVVRACAEFYGHPRRPCSLDILVTMTGAPVKVADAAMQRAAARSLIECGVSLRTAWPTAKGRRLLGAESATVGRVLCD